MDLVVPPFGSNACERQSPCGPTTGRVLLGHLCEAIRKDLGEESIRFREREGRKKIFRQACSFVRGLSAGRAHAPDMPYYVTKSGGPTRGSQPQQYVPQTTEGKAVCESARRGWSNR